MIYFITARELDRVKIGFSNAPWARFAKMQSDSPTRLAFEGVTEGDKATESAFHTQFSASRFIGEWFTIAPEIEALMATLPTPVRAARNTPVKDLVMAAGISTSYASQILSGQRRPPLSLAVHIFRTAGWKHPRLAGATDAEIDGIASIVPWTPQKERVAA
jgi:hypothetical protein